MIEQPDLSDAATNLVERFTNVVISDREFFRHLHFAEAEAIARLAYATGADADAAAIIHAWARADEEFTPGVDGQVVSEWLALDPDTDADRRDELGIENESDEDLETRSAASRLAGADAAARAVAARIPGARTDWDPIGQQVQFGHARYVVLPGASEIDADRAGLDPESGRWWIEFDDSDHLLDGPSADDIDGAVAWIAAARAAHTSRASSDAASSASAPLTRREPHGRRDQPDSDPTARYSGPTL